MLENIIKTCNNFSSALEHRCNPTEEERMVLNYLNIDLAKSIIEDLDENNTRSIIGIILGYENKIAISKLSFTVDQNGNVIK